MSKGKKKITAESTVYVSGAGWRDCDTSIGCVALTAKKAESCCIKEMREAAKRARDDDWDEKPRKSLADHLDDIAYYGVHAMALEDLVSDSELPEAIKALQNGEVYYPERG